jgi:N-acetylmuramoyl-L-alanine amidase
MLKRFLFFTIIALTICTSALYAQKYELRTVVLDPGHGGRDPGAVAGNIREKDIVLDVCLQAGQLIKAAFPEVNVVYTRKTDVFVPLDTRAEIANKNKADLFISVHANHCGTPSVTGAETFVLGLHRSQENLEVAKLENSVILLEDDYSTRYEGFDPNEPESYIMFELIQDQYLEQSTQFANRMQTEFVNVAKRNNRGVKQAGFLVLRRTTMPSVLLELGFLSNSNESRYLNSAQGRTDMAVSIANAFSNYKNRVENRSFSNLTTDQNAQQTPATTGASQLKPQEPIASTKSNKNNAPSQPNNQQTTNNETSSKQTTEEQTNTLQSITSLSGTWYAVQIMSLNREEPANSPLFKGHSPIYTLYENGLHKYYLQPHSSYKAMTRQLAKVKAEFEGSFPVGVVDGKKVNVNTLPKNN